jgi:ribonuclease PH
MSWQRPEGRSWNQLRPVKFLPGFSQFASSSVMAQSGKTQVLCNVSIQPQVPKFLEGSGKGWLTAEYRMLPAATHQRQERELIKLSGRTQEIQRLIGRSLRAALDLHALGEMTIIVDADVLQADAGTRTTAINGGYVALAQAIAKLVELGKLERSPLRHQIAAISIGLIEGQPLLDLDYPEDVAADVDFNIVMSDSLEIIELQGTAESKSFSRTQFNQILDLAEVGIKQILQWQREATPDWIICN